jgi:hypothetical protein
MLLSLKLEVKNQDPKNKHKINLKNQIISSIKLFLPGIIHFIYDLLFESCYIYYTF